MSWPIRVERTKYIKPSVFKNNQPRHIDCGHTVDGLDKAIEVYIEMAYLIDGDTFIPRHTIVQHVCSNDCIEDVFEQLKEDTE